jgi:hypothetical protein
MSSREGGRVAFRSHAFAESLGPMKLRNIAIIAHVDHG